MLAVTSPHAALQKYLSSCYLQQPGDFFIISLDEQESYACVGVCLSVCLTVSAQIVNAETGHG